MTSISSNSAALTILTQTSPTADSSKSATDNILSIVSNGQKADTAPTKKIHEAKVAESDAPSQKVETKVVDQPREVGGTVSSEISSTWASAMGAVVINTLNNSSVEDGSQIVSATSVAKQATTDSWEKTVSDAVNRAVTTVSLAVAINGKFHLEQEVDLDSRLSTIETQRQGKIANGVSDDVANAQAELLKRAASGAVTHTKMINENRLDLANGTLVNYNDILKQAGVEGAVSVDENGRANVSAFYITDSSGRKLVSLGENGRMTTYNADGSVKNEMSREDVALATRNVNTYAYTLQGSGADLNQLKLF